MPCSLDFLLSYKALKCYGDIGCKLVTAFHTMSVILPSPSYSSIQLPLSTTTTVAATDLCIVYYTVGHKKTCHFYFYDNFGKCGPISIILSLLDS